MKAVPVIFFAILVFGILAFLGWIGFSFYQQGQGPALEATTKPVFSTRTPKAFANSSTLVPSTVVRSLTPTVLVESKSNPVPDKKSTPVSAEVGCGESGAWNILILGSDYSEMLGKKGSDLTRMLRADFDNKRVIIFAFPRDLWVDTDGIGFENPQIYAARLGTVYYEGRLRSLQFAELDTMVDGTRMTSRVLSKDFSLNTDHYITLDLSDLGSMIDAIGGLPIFIPKKISYPGNEIVINEGQQILDGLHVMTYARALPDSDFDRISRNDLILEALRKKILDPTVYIKIPELYKKYKKNVATDLSLEQITHLACLIKNIPTASIIMEGVKPEWTTRGPQNSLLWSKPDVVNRLRELGLIQ